MIDIARDEPTKVVRILASPAAAALMHQKLDTVDVFEKSRLARISAVPQQGAVLEFFDSAFTIQFRQLRHLVAIHLRSCEAKFLFECLLENADVSVFTKHQGNHKPVISRSHLDVGPPVSHKSTLLPP